MCLEFSGHPSPTHDWRFPFKPPNRPGHLQTHQASPAPATPVPGRALTAARRARPPQHQHLRPPAALDPGPRRARLARGRQCHSTLPLAAIDCHSLGVIYILILLSPLSFSVRMRRRPWLGSTRSACSSSDPGAPGMLLPGPPACAAGDVRGTSCKLYT